MASTTNGSQNIHQQSSGNNVGIMDSISDDGKKAYKRLISCFQVKEKQKTSHYVQLDVRINGMA